MNTVELRANIAHRLEDISDPVFLKELNTMLDFNVSEPVFRCTAEQRKAIVQAQQAVAQGKGISHSDIQKSVELWANAN